jgi:hypothetical protein
MIAFILDQPVAAVAPDVMSVKRVPVSAALVAEIVVTPQQVLIRVVAAVEVIVASLSEQAVVFITAIKIVIATASIEQIMTVAAVKKVAIIAAKQPIE